jgi:uncharacterized membrane protein
MQIVFVGCEELMPKGRLEAFSDGVIAIVITLLVLEIRIPQLPQHAGNREVMKVLTQLVPRCAAYFISFAVCAVWWVAHHNFIHDLREVNRQLLWANNLLLLWAGVAASLAAGDILLIVFSRIGAKK